MSDFLFTKTGAGGNEPVLLTPVDGNVLYWNGTTVGNYNIAGALASKANLAGPTFTGTTTADNLTVTGLGYFQDISSDGTIFANGGIEGNGTGLTGTAAGLNIGGNAASLALSGGSTVVNGGANIVDIRNGTSPQTVFAFNTYSGGGTNYERGVYGWGSVANRLTFATQAGGTGVERDIEFLSGVNGGQIQMTASGFIFFNKSNTGTRLTIDPSGGVAIAQTLTVAGASTLTGNVTTSGNLLSTDGSSSGKVQLGSVSNYPGIWFGTNTVTPSLSNYSFLYDNGAGQTILNSPTSVSLRVSNAQVGAITSGGMGVTGTLTVTGATTLGAGTVSAAPLRFTSGSLLATPAAGRMEYDGNALYFSPADTRRSVNLADGVIVASTTVANTTSPTVIFTEAVTANALHAGEKVRVLIDGIYSTANGSDTFTATLKMGSTTIDTITSVAGNVTNVGASIDLLFTVRSAGVSGTIMPRVVGIFNNVVKQDVNTAVTTIDTTILEDITLTIQWSAANASNTFTVQQAHAEFIN